MKNFLQPGVNLTLPAAADIKSGEVFILGAITGIAAGDALEDEMVDVVTSGVFSVDKVGADSFSVGDGVFYDATTKLATSTASGNTKIGTAVKVAVSGSASVEVRLVAF